MQRRADYEAANADRQVSGSTSEAPEVAASKGSPGLMEQRRELEARARRLPNSTGWAWAGGCLVVPLVLRVILAYEAIPTRRMWM
jgi:hypothetical protein